MDIFKDILKRLLYAVLGAGSVYIIGAIGYWIFTLVFLPSYIFLPTIYGIIMRFLVVLFAFAGLLESEKAF